MATLGFSTQWPKNMGGGLTNFVSKIWRCILVDKSAGLSIFDYNRYSDFAEEANFRDRYLSKNKNANNIKEAFNVNKVYEHMPKLHTIREDSKNLWVPGRKIHMVIFNRTKNRFQFAPVLEVKSIQHIKITYDEKVCEECCIEPAVFVNGKLQDIDKLEQLARNDGFESAQQFCQWFNEDFTGKIIHWTDLKY